MIKKTLLLSILFSFSAFGEQSLEVKLNLSQAGFEKFKAHIGVPEFSREDIYFEAFNAEVFLLERQASPLKYRLKNKGEKGKIQLRRVLLKSAFACQDVELKGSLREEEETKLDHAKVDQLASASEQTFSSMDGLEPAINETLTYFEELLSAATLKGKSWLEEAIIGQRVRLVPTHGAKKYKANRLVQTKSGDVKISLGQAVQIGVNKNVFYELEFEPLSPEAWTVARLLSWSCQYLSDLDIQASDQGPQAGSRKERSLEQLIKLRGYLF